MKQLLVIVALVITTCAHAEDWGSIGKKVSSNVVYVAVLPNSSVNYVGGSVHSSTGGEILGFTAGAPVTITNALAAGLSNILATTSHATSSLTNGDHVLIQGQNEQFQWAQLNAVTASGLLITNVLNGAALTTDFALVAGDKIYRLTEVYGEQLGPSLATSSRSGGVLLKDSNGRPALFLLNATGVVTNLSLSVGGTR